MDEETKEREEIKEPRNGRGVSISKVADDSIEVELAVEGWKSASGERQQRAFTPLWCVGVLTRGRATWYRASRGELAARTNGARCGAAQRTEGVEIQIS